jgi:tetratricopeptide (TPR) repeat protein
MADYRAHLYREAIREFELASGLLPSADLHWNLARAYEQLGEYARSVEHYELYLRDRVDAPDATGVRGRIERLRRWITASEHVHHTPDVSMLALDAGDPRQTVVLDGRALQAAPVDRLLSVTPGRHRLEVSQPGMVPFLAEIETSAGALSAAHIELVPTTPRAANRSPSAMMWALASVSAALFVTSGAFGLVAVGQRGDGHLPTAKRWAIASDVALGGAAGSALGAALLYLANGREPASQRVQPPASWAGPAVRSIP